MQHLELNQLQTEQPTPAPTEIQQTTAQEQPTPTEISTSKDDFFDDLLTPAKGGEEFTETFVNNPILEAEEVQKVAFSEPSINTVSAEDLHNVAVENCKIAMDMRENLQAYGLSLYVEGNISDFPKYLYAPAQKENLVRAWSRVFQEHNIRVPAYLDIVQAELFATGPLLALAVGNRKLRKQNEALQAELEQYKSGNATPSEPKKSNGEPYGRADIKTLWQVDNNGYFEWTKRNGKFVRLTKAEKKTRPTPTGEVLERLIKYNGQEKISAIYGG